MKKEIYNLMVNDFLPNKLKFKKFYDNNTDIVDIVAYVSINDLDKLNLSDEQMSFALDILDKYKICVNKDDDFSEFRHDNVSKKSMMKIVPWCVQRNWFIKLNNLKLETNMKDEYFKLRNKIVEANIGIIFYVIEMFKTNEKYFSELKSQGYVLLINAVEKFNYLVGRDFSSYAYKVLLNGFTNYYSKLVGFKTYKEYDDLINAISKVKNYYEFNGIKAKPAKEDIVFVLVKDYKYTDEEAEFMFSKYAVNEPENIENYEDYDSDFSVDNIIEFIIQKNVVEEAISKLTLKQQYVIKLRYGFMDEGPKDLKEIAKMLNVSVAAVEGVIKGAKKKLYMLMKTYFQKAKY